MTFEPRSPAPIPTNLFTGLLGVGKTTSILGLLARKSDQERWAILVNEFGDVAIDHAVLEASGESGVFIREVAGGCLCCTAGVPLQIALTLLIREAKPDRVIVEMSGMGHPGYVLRSIRDGRFADTLDLRATVCLVDPRDVEDLEIRDTQTFQDQVQLSDVLLLTKMDLSEPEVTDEAYRWAESLFPPKHVVAKTDRGALNPAWLDLDRDSAKIPLFNQAHEEARAHQRDHHNEEDVYIAPGRPYRSENHGFDRHACGWIFHQDELFDNQALLDFLSEDDHIERIKGVFRIGGDWILLDRVGDVIETRPTAYCLDSRIEVITRNTNPDWGRFEAGLTDCVRSGVVA